MGGKLAEETPHNKESYKELAATHGDRVWVYRAENKIFADNLFKEAVQTFRGGSHHQNAIVEQRIKVLTLGSQTLLLHATRLCPESVSTTLWHLSFITACKIYNRLEMDEDQNTPDQKVSGVEF